VYGKSLSTEAERYTKVWKNAWSFKKTLKSFR
jgi:hypothetical protein